MRCWAVAAVLLVAVAGEARAADCNHPMPVQFPPGASSVTIPSGPPSPTSDCYQVTAAAEQNLIVKVAGENGDAVLSVYGPGWTASCTPAGDCDLSGDLMSEDNTTDWAETLETGGTYLIVVDNSHSDSQYRLTVEIEG